MIWEGKGRERVCGEEALGPLFQTSHLPIDQEEEVALALGEENGDEPGTQH